jgi:hypothetical protein
MSEILQVIIFGIICTFIFGTKPETNYVNCTMETQNKLKKRKECKIIDVFTLFRIIVKNGCAKNFIVSRVTM